MKIIINADDLGMSREVNDAVFALMRRGRVTSATVLANGAATEDAVARALEFPECSFGVHLNASELHSLTTDSRLSPIQNDDGTFISNHLREVLVTPSLVSAVASEWLAQVQRLQTLGLSISHLDSHHHMHTVPGLFFALKEVQKTSGIRRVRTTMNIYSRRLNISTSLRLRKALWDFALRYCITTLTTDGFTSLEVFVEAAHEQKSLGRFKVVELMVHPGARYFAHETRLLESEWWRELPFTVDAINYNEL